MKGFSIIEVVIVVSVMMILSGTVLTYNRSNYGQLALFSDRSIFISAVNRAKSLAIEKFNKNADSCAFGIYIKKEPGNIAREFTLFQDLKTDPTKECKLESGDNNFNNIFDAGEAIQTFKLDSRIKFSGVGQDVSVVFAPPELATFASLPLPITVTLATLDDELFSEVGILASGQITTN